MDGSPEPPQEHPSSRLVALSLAWAKTALIIVAAFAMALLGGQDPGGQAYLYGGFLLGGIYWLVFILPALLLLHRATGRHVGLAFGFLIMPDILLAVAAASL